MKKFSLILLIGLLTLMFTQIAPAQSGMWVADDHFFDMDIKVDGTADVFMPVTGSQKDLTGGKVFFSVAKVKGPDDMDQTKVKTFDVKRMTVERFGISGDYLVGTITLPPFMRKDILKANTLWRFWGRIGDTWMHINPDDPAMKENGEKLIGYEAAAVNGKVVRDTDGYLVKPDEFPLWRALASK